MQAGVYFVTQSAYDVSKESLKNNIGLKFAFRSTDLGEIKQTLEFFGIEDVYKRQPYTSLLFASVKTKNKKTKQFILYGYIFFCYIST